MRFVKEEGSCMDLDEAARYIDEIAKSAELIQVPYQGSNVAWRRFGQGHPLVMLHGGHGSWLHWIRNIEVLSRTHEVWLPDMPGFGDSVDVPVRDMDALLLAMLAMLDQLFPSKDIDLVGFSFGGLTAANIAARFPRVRKLALLGPAGHGGPRRQATALANWRHSKSIEELHATMRSNLAIHMLANPAVIDGLALTAHIRSCEKVQFRSKGVSRSWKLADALSKVQSPVLILWGEHDVTADPGLILPILLGDSDARHGEILPEGGHWVQFELADTINARLTNWFSAP
jgi:pimeloyl-ACP methyl ester carboxylesterase